MQAISKSIKRVGLVFPTNSELKPFLELMPELKLSAKSPWEKHSGVLDNLSISAIVSYIGPANAAAATEHLMSDAPQIILHGGAAGAINPELMPGDIVIGQTYKILCSRPILQIRRNLLLSNKGIRYLRDGNAVHLEQLNSPAELLVMAEKVSQRAITDFPIWNAGGWPQSYARRQPRVLLGSLGSQDGWTKDENELEFFRTEFGVDTEDMESAYVAQIAAMHNVPCLTVRAISNNEHVGTLAREEIFPAVSEAAMRVGKILSMICRSLAQEATGTKTA